MNVGSGAYRGETVAAAAGRAHVCVPWLLSVAFSMAVACTPPSSGADAGHDASLLDAGLLDARSSDARSLDAGALDAGAIDFELATDHAGSVVTVPGRSRLAVVTPAASEVRLFSWDERGALALEHVFRTARGPRTISVWGPYLAVVCQDDGVVELLRYDEPFASITLELPLASRPYASVGRGDELFVTLQALGRVARVELDGGIARVTASFEVVDDARGITRLPDARLAVTRWRSPDGVGVVAVLDPSDATVQRWTVPLVDGRVVGYLDPLLVSPDGASIALPSLRAAVGEGAYRSGRPLTPTGTLGAVVSWFEMDAGSALFDTQSHVEGAGLAAAGVFSSSGEHLFVALRGRRAVTRINVETRRRGPTIEEVGFAPDGLALSSDGMFLFVHASLSREVVVYGVATFAAGASPLGRASTVDDEPWTETVLRGARVFNDSFDSRISRDGSIACAHCHLDGAHDSLVWDFTDRGEGLRNTISLRGWQHRPSDRPIHWSANFDELEDFEHDIRGPFGGSGLMADADFATDGRDTPLGAPKRGFAPDLGAVDAYLTSTTAFSASPFREADGTLPPAALRGRVLFESAETRCVSCHASDALTDSRFIRPGEPLLHDVRTFGPGSGQRLGGRLEGLVTPPLHDLWESAPYLHDGSAPTLRDVLTTRNEANEHGRTRHLSGDEVDDLVAYLRCLDGRRD